MTALLLMDFQRMVVESYAVDKQALLGRVKRLAVAARNSGAMVIHVPGTYCLTAVHLRPSRTYAYTSAQMSGDDVRNAMCGQPKLLPTSRFCNQGVGGSNPSAGTNKNNILRTSQSRVCWLVDQLVDH
jgi:nicotinamidase-related amidase